MERFGETWKRKGQDESDTGDKNKVEDLVKTWLVFFEKNLNKIANLDQKTCKNKTMKGNREWQNNQLIRQNQQIQA